MKVFELSYVSAGYGRGICLVAANDKEEALKIANLGLNYRKFEDPDEHSLLTCNTDEPRVILECVYQE